MDAHTAAQTVNLWGLEQGQFMTVTITDAPGDCVLEFKNGSSPTWSIDPNFSGVVTNGVLSERVKCLSAHTRVRFLEAPSEPYWLTLVWDATPTF